VFEYGGFWITRFLINEVLQ